MIVVASCQSAKCVCVKANEMKVSFRLDEMNIRQKNKKKEKKDEDD